MLLRTVIALGLAAGAGISSLYAQVLFDGSQGSGPEAQGWIVFAPPPQTSGFAEGAFTLDSRPAGNAGLGGLSRQAPSDLDSAAGYSLRLTLQVTAETHQSAHRSGVSLIVLGADRRGIELAFWTDRLWAQADSPLFTHAEEGLIDTTRGFVEYTVAVSGNAYTVTADGIPVLSGPLRNYTAFTGFPDVYEIPNLLFLGDDTTSASGALSLRRVELVTTTPKLSIRTQSTAALEVTWPANAGLWTLEQSAVLGDTSNWRPVEDSPSNADGFHRLTLTADASARYFRLRR
jgi:hypothetical protein